MFPRLGFFSGDDLIVSLLIGLSMERAFRGRSGGLWCGFSTFDGDGEGWTEIRVYGLRSVFGKGVEKVGPERPGDQHQLHEIRLPAL